LFSLVLITRTKFYSWYIYHDNEADEGRSISSAEYVEDVNSDSVVIVDGLTKVLPTLFFRTRTFAADYRIELATSWVAGLLGYWSQESYNCPVSIWYVGQCDSYNPGQTNQLRPQARSWMVVPITRKHTSRRQEIFT
jgi:hypothetical protein